MSEKELAVLRFVNQRRAAKAESKQEDQLQVAFPRTTLRVPLEPVSLTHSNSNHRSTLKIDHDHQDSHDESSHPHHDAFDTDFEDADSASVLSQSAASPLVRAAEAGMFTSHSQADGTSAAQVSADSYGRPYRVHQKPPSGQVSENMALSLAPKLKYTPKQHNYTQTHKAVSAIQAGWLENTPSKQVEGTPKASLRHPLKARLSFEQSSEGRRSLVEQARSREGGLGKNAENGTQRHNTHSVSRPPTQRYGTRNRKSVLLADQRSAELDNQGIVFKAQATVEHESDLDSRSSQEEEPDPAQGTHVFSAIKRKRSLDYSREQLARMTYQNLKDESFDIDPSMDNDGLPAKLINGTVLEKLQYAFSCRKDEHKAAHRIAFFSSLTIEEHEECGDMIVEKFRDSLTRLKDLRQQKRALCREFEREIEQRHYLIEAKKDAIDQDFKMMRAKGNDLVPKKPTTDSSPC